MKKIKNKVSKLDNVDKFGIIFGIVFMLPSVTLLVVDVIVNGAKML